MLASVVGVCLLVLTATIVAAEPEPAQPLEERLQSGLAVVINQGVELYNIARRAKKDDA